MIGNPLHPGQHQNYERKFTLLRGIHPSEPMKNENKHIISSTKIAAQSIFRKLGKIARNFS